MKGGVSKPRGDILNRKDDVSTRKLVDSDRKFGDSNHTGVDWKRKLSTRTAKASNQAERDELKFEPQSF